MDDAIRRTLLLPCKWRDPTLALGIDPLPPPDDARFPRWRDETLAYFSRSPYYDPHSLTEMMGKGAGVDASMAAAVFSQKSGVFYQCGLVGQVPTVVELYNVSANNACETQTQVAYYYILDGTVHRAPRTLDVVADGVGRAARSLRAAIDASTQRMLEEMEASAEVAAKAEAAAAQQQPPPAKRARREHVAGPAVRQLIEAAVHEEHRRHNAMRAAEAEHMARVEGQNAKAAAAAAGGAGGAQAAAEAAGLEKLGSGAAEVTFADERSRSVLCFSAGGEGGAELVYTV
eukprot:Rhum_TRINITY_DN21122_c1_g1::Rhum_TRINITY_DN21122_c1_g1_i1::g.173253::m.173253/K15128/MED6; mediator of RNA polymerase II transcription subunit 6